MLASSGWHSEAPGSPVTQYVPMLKHGVPIGTQSLGSGVPTAFSEVSLQALLEGFHITQDLYI